MTFYQSLDPLIKQKVDERFQREYRYNPQYDETIRSINERLGGLTSQDEVTQRRLQEDYTNQNSNLQDQYGKGIESLQERLANQGILRSGINVGEQGRMGTELQKSQGELSTGLARSKEDWARQLAGNKQALETERRGAENTRAQEEAGYRETLARQEAETDANARFQEQQRLQLEDLKQQLLKSQQPITSPTGQLQPPPPMPKMPTLNAGTPIQPKAPTVPRASDTGTIQAMGIDPTYLQKMLQIRGFDPGPIDGQIGAKTQRALIMWKQSVGLPANIDFDPSVWDTLKSSGIGNISTTGGLSAFPQSGPARRSLI